MLVNKSRKEVVTGDIVWHEGRSYSFIQYDGEWVCLKTTDDSRRFTWLSLPALGWEEI
jgi:hypothetical protein